jgi:hypothetical protein
MGSVRWQASSPHPRLPGSRPGIGGPPKSPTPVRRDPHRMMHSGASGALLRSAPACFAESGGCRGLRPVWPSLPGCPDRSGPSVSPAFQRASRSVVGPSNLRTISPVPCDHAAPLVPFNTCVALCCCHRFSQFPSPCFHLSDRHFHDAQGGFRRSPDAWVRFSLADPLAHKGHMVNASLTSTFERVGLPISRGFLTLLASFPFLDFCLGLLMCGHVSVIRTQG